MPQTQQCMREHLGLLANQTAGAATASMQETAAIAFVVENTDNQPAVWTSERAVPKSHAPLSRQLKHS